MKIVCIGPAHPLRGGIANFNTALCRSLVRSGHSVSVVSFSLQYPGFLFPGKTQVESGPVPGNLPIRSIIHSLGPFSWFRTARLILSENPDLLVVHHWIPFIALSVGSIVRRVKAGSRIPVIAVLHNVIPHEKHLFWKWLTSNLLRRCDGFIALSRSVLEDLDSFTGNPHKLFIPHPVYDIFGQVVERHEAAIKLSLDPSGRYILFFGYVRRYKGLELLIRAFARCRERLPGVRLIVAGEFYSPRQEYTDLIRRLDLESGVIIREGFVPRDQVKYYFSLADLVAQPYLSATQSGVTQIAYHFGVPMLVTDTGGLAEMVPDGKAGYVTRVSEEDIAAALTDFFTRDRAAEFKKHLPAERKRFSWEAMASGIEKLAGRIREYD